MQLNLIRNGYNVDRRKMYSQNPRNNLISTVDLYWQQSLEDEKKFVTSKLKNKVINEKEQIKKYYDSLVDKRLQAQKSIVKNSFRIMPVFQTKQDNNRKPTYLNNHNMYQINLTGRQNKNKMQYFRQRLSVPNISLQNQSNRYRQNYNIINHAKTSLASHQTNNLKATSGQILNPSSFNIKQKNQLKNSHLSKTVFGYEINPQTFKRESYLTKLLSDRLNPYLQKANNHNHKRHNSISGVNQIIDLNY